MLVLADVDKLNPCKNSIKKESNSLMLKENGDNTITIILEGETLSDDSYRCCHITVE